jgi:hypothetical protein
MQNQMVEMNAHSFKMRITIKVTLNAQNNNMPGTRFCKETYVLIVEF